MPQRRDQHGLELEDGPVVDVLWHFEHRSHRKVGLVRTEHGHAITASHVVQFQAYAGVGLGEAFDHLRQKIKNSGLPGSDIDLSAVEIPQLTGEGFRNAINTLDQGLGKFQ